MLWTGLWSRRDIGYLLKVSKVPIHLCHRPDYVSLTGLLKGKTKIPVASSDSPFCRAKKVLPVQYEAHEASVIPTLTDVFPSRR